MSTKNINKKILRKQKRSQHLITSETKIPCTDVPTTNLVICNAGLSTGLLQENLLTTVTAAISQIIMIPGKSYCFIRCPDIGDAQQVYSDLHGKTQLAQNDGVLYVSYCDDVPTVENPWSHSLPPGLILLEDFIEVDEELALLECIRFNEAEDIGSTLKHRAVQHYGYEFLYGSNNVDINHPLERKIPSQCDFLWPRLRGRLVDLQISEPDQLTVNRYQPGQGIPPHVDTHSAFLDPIMSLSLGSDVVMEFRNGRGPIVNCWVPRRSLLIMSKESRYGWTHGITPRKIDVTNVVGAGLSARYRDVRVSLTFRTLKREPCRSCGFPKLCDTFKEQMALTHTSEPVNAAKLEAENVHRVYDVIANHFSETRHSPWPQVEEFVQSFKLGAVLIDVGCGNGKYLSSNDATWKIGCDRSQGLLNVCRQRGLNTFQCDCLYLPVRNSSIDGCISIAVIHHLASKDRRLQAIQEMVRVLTVGGRALIYVWAKNQARDNRQSSYLRQNKRNTKEITTETSIDGTGSMVQYVAGLPVHTNRTQFAHQDMLVPWKLKENKSDETTEVTEETYLRFYHVFEEHELENLCADVQDAHIVRSYYDQGNWCVVLQKIL